MNRVVSSRWCPAQYLLYCTLEIVIPTKSEYSPKIGKGSLVSLQKCLLTGVREGAMERSSTCHAAHAKYVGLFSLSPDIGESLIPVHLRFFSPNVGLRNKGLVLNQFQFNFPLANITTNRALGDSDFRKLLPYPRPDPVRCVSLLSRRVLVALQNGFDEGLHRFYPRLTPHVDLSLAGNRISQRLPYHTPVDPQLPRHSFDRSHPVVILPSNLFE
jgi:hypothetical protein